MQLSSIKEYLEKYQKKLSHEDDKRSLLISIIHNETGIQLDEKTMTITKGTLMIKTSPVLKNELFLHKTQILQRIRESGRGDIFDIT